MFDKISLGKRVQDFSTDKQYDAYTGVIVCTEEGDDSPFGYYGDITTDRVLYATVPICTSTTQASQIAKNIFNSLIHSDTKLAFQYQPYEANGVELPPYYEVGDGVSIGDNMYSGIYKQELNFDTLCTSSIGAPGEESIDHEFEYISEGERKVQRQFVKQKEEYTSNFEITSQKIQSEVTARTNADSQLSSKITQTASQINAEVNKKVNSDGSATRESFGWKLTSDGFFLYSSNNTVFACDRTGVTVKGKIQAESGYIGGTSGFTILGGRLYSGSHSSYDSKEYGVYIGNDGISLGSNFRVSANGAIYAYSGEFSGKLSASAVFADGVNIRDYVNSCYSSAVYANQAAYTAQSAASSAQSSANTAYGYANTAKNRTEGGGTFSNGGVNTGTLTATTIRMSGNYSAGQGVFQLNPATADVRLAGGGSFTMHYVSWSQVG